MPQAWFPSWTERLLQANASFYQLHYWNEPYRRVRCTTHHLFHGPPDGPTAAVCVLALGFVPLRIGLVHHGPVLLEPSASAPERLAAALLRWARGRGIAFLRFTHENEALLAALAAGGPGERIDGFPFHRGDPRWDLVLRLPEEEARLLASFRKDARREIRRDQARGYGVRIESSPKALAGVWPMFLAHARRRGFRHNRPLVWWQDVLRLAEPHAAARLYVASRGETPVAADLYVHDRLRVRSITAWDEAALDGEPSPSSFLLFQAMGDLLRLGIRDFSFGPATGSLAAYKHKFRPALVVHPPPLTLVADERRYRTWRALVLRFARRWPKLRRALGR